MDNTIESKLLPIAEQIANESKAPVVWFYGDSMQISLPEHVDYSRELMEYLRDIFTHSVDVFDES